MPTSTQKRATRATLWISMVALLLVAMTSQVEVRTCLGVCAIDVASAPSCCDEVAPFDVSSTCCGCCEQPGEDAPAPDDPTPAEDDGCCVTIAFDVDQAPGPETCKLRLPPAVICWLEPLKTAVARVPEAARPFYYDRGPPRVDQRTVLRATQVLLI
ncbi:MAG: hypothetical protein VYA51_10300 [Planctomycetota bacterium]|nr:hypothetical protein [Planctomycetota bacterium]